jgi:hypothetical protein
MFRKIIIACSVVALAGCARSSAIPLSADTIQLTTSAARVCGATGAQSAAVRRASIETLQRGFDRFLILGGGYENDIRVVGHTPVVANTTGTAVAYGGNGYGTAYGQSQTTYSGGQPIVAGSHKQGLTVKMFKDGDPAGANAVSARSTLGPNWQDAIKEGGNGFC